MESMTDYCDNMSDNISNAKITFTFKFDLCNPSIIDLDTKKGMQFLKKLSMHSSFKPEKPTWEYYNRSYLSIREPILCLKDTAPKKTISFNGKQIPFNHTIKIYPGQGVISTILTYELVNTSAYEIKDFYNMFQKERGLEYNSYLKEGGKEVVTKWLKETIDEDQNELSENYTPILNIKGYIYDVVKQLRYILFPEKSDHHYYFESYRTIITIKDKIFEQFPFIINGPQCIKKQEYLKIYALLTGSVKPVNISDEDVETITKPICRYDDNYIIIGDWASVFLIEDDKDSQNFENEAIFLYDFAHTFWFICQKWIYILPKYFNEIETLLEEVRGIEKHNRAQFQDKINDITTKRLNLRSYISQIQQSLIEAKDVDLMFFNSGYRNIMQKFYDSLKIVPHLNLVDSNLAFLEICHQQLTESLAQKHTFETEKLTFNINILLGGVSCLFVINLLKGLSFFGITLNGWPLLGIGALLFASFVIVAYYNYDIFRYVSDLLLNIGEKFKF